MVNNWLAGIEESMETGKGHHAVQQYYRFRDNIRTGNYSLDTVQLRRIASIEHRLACSDGTRAAWFYRA